MGSAALAWFFGACYFRAPHAVPSSPSSPPSLRRRVDVIVNRVARKLTERGAVLSAIRAAALESPGRAFVHETRSLADLEEAVATIKTVGTSCVLLAGGDGSYLAGATALRRAYGDALPQIGFAPGGTVGTVARNWGFSGDAARYAGRLVRAALDGTASQTPRPTLRVRDDTGGDRVGFIFGAGLVSHFFDVYDEAPAQGYAAAAAIVARVFFGSVTQGALARRVLRPEPCELSVDGASQLPAAWSLIAASVVRDLGLHMRLLYRAGEDYSAFHAVASALPARLLGPQLPRVLAGRPLRGEGHVDRLATELTVTFPRPSTYVLDGDRIVASRVTVTPGPVLDFVALRRAPA